ncbi:ABC transporter substrate-binding protein [Virgibacillus dokdonensis]|uniref:ABC transporter substrate-binding protein n=1 Tax=Virgibacillus dokdonensis TaxID=302167 RepID=A0ABU7VH10_9BACI
MRNYLFISLLFLLIFLVGCNNQDDQSEQHETQSKGDTISVTDSSKRTIDLEKSPEKIVALSNGDVDIIYALGHKVVGRPSGKTIVSEAKDALEIGSNHSLDLEKITSLEPDLVLGNHPMNMKDIQAVEDIGAEMVLTSANSVQDIQKQISLFGDLLNKQDKAQQIVHKIDNKRKEVKENTVEKKPRTLLIYGAPGTNMAALPNSLSGNILELAGGINIASDYPSLEMYPQYAQLNTERIIESNPEIILLMTHGNPEKVKESLIKEMSQTAGWDELDAVKNNRLVILPSNLFGTNPGTKVIESIDYLYDVLKNTRE